MTLDEAVARARAVIDADDLDGLRSLIAEHPDLLTWRDSSGEVLLQATTSYANFPGAEHEDHWNRRACAAFLIDAGAVVDPRVWLRAMTTGAHGMLAMFEEKGVLPDNLRVVTALGDEARVRACFDDAGRLTDRARPAPELRTSYENAAADWPDPSDDDAVLADAFLCASRLGHREVAAFLLARSVAADPDLGTRIEAWEGEDAFLDFMLEQECQGTRFALANSRANVPLSPVWQRAVDLRLHAAMHQGRVDEVRTLLASETFVLGEGFLDSQAKLLEVASYSEDTLPVIDALLASDAAIVESEAPPGGRAIGYALEYGNADYVPSLAKIWPVPDDLPHAAGLGDMSKVARWFDADGMPALGDLQRHDPFPGHATEVTQQEVLDRALAWAVRNNEFGVADYLLDHGADINTRWGTHEPASLLHECAGAGNMTQVRYLLRRGIDVTLEDTRFAATAEGWARWAGFDEVADLLASHAPPPEE